MSKQKHVKRRTVIASGAAAPLVTMGAKPAAAATQYILVTDQSLTPYVADVLAIWNNRYGILITPGGPETPPGPGVIFAVGEQQISHSGLTSRNEDGSYTVQVGAVAWLYGPGTILHTFAHEVGHAIIHPLGGGWWHAANHRDLMFATHQPGDRLGRVTKETKDYIAGLL